MTGGQKRQRAGTDPCALRAGQPLAVTAHQLRCQRPAALGPERNVRRVAHRALAVARRALLAAAVHLHLGGVQIDRHRLPRLAPERAIEMIANARGGALDPLAVHTTKVLRALQSSRCRRRPAHRPQPITGRVRAHLLQIGEELPAD